MHGTVWYSVLYRWDSPDEGLEMRIWCARGAPLTFSARPSSPAARKRNFLTRFPRPANVADAAMEETAVEAADATLAAEGARLGTSIGMV